MSILKTLSSLKLTLPLMLLLLVAVLYSYRLSSGSAVWMAIPLLLLAFNLLAALIVNPRFRRQGGLMTFHLCLLAFLLLAAIGQLTSLQGRIEITEGQWFDSDQIQLQSAGPWHPDKQLQKISFQQDAIRVNYNAGLIRGHTQSEILIIAAGEEAVRQTVGDNVPLRITGYRFYTSSNKGFALLLTWRGEDGAEHTGSVNLPSYPLNDWQLKRDWTTPAGEQVTLLFQLHKAAPTGKPWVLTQQTGAGQLGVIINDQKYSFEPGQWIKVNGGSIRFDDVRMWMGYEVFFNPVLPWLFAVALVGVCGLGFHYWGRFGPHSQPELVRNSSIQTGNGRHASA